MSATDTKADRNYTKEHEWALLEDGVVVIGITSFAVDQLGDVTLVNFDADVGDTLVAGSPFGTIESVKTLSDLFAPISGEVVELNEALEDEPELVNDDVWGKGWLIKVKPESAGALKTLMDAAEYDGFVENSD